MVILIEKLLNKLLDNKVRKLISYFEIEGSESQLDDVRKKYASVYEKCGVLSFPQESSDYSHFIEYANQQSLKLVEKYFIEHKGKSDYSDAYYRLSLKDTNEFVIYQKTEIDSKKAYSCKECGFGYQVDGQFTLTPKHKKLVDKYDFVICNVPVSSRIMLASSYLMDVFVKNNVSGYEVIRHYQDEKMYALKVVEALKKLPEVGKLSYSKGCPSCGTLSMYDTKQTAVFSEDSFDDKDFYFIDGFQSEGKNYYELAEGIIASRRIILLLKELKIKGLVRFSTDPPVELCAINIE